MANLFIILACMSVFFTLQAFYWWRASGRASRDAVLAERLGRLNEDDDENDGLLRTASKGDSFFDNIGIGQRIQDLLEQAGQEGDIGPFLVQTAIAFFGAFSAIIVITGTPFFAFLMALLAMLIPYMLLQGKIRTRMARIEEQLPEALEVMAISLRAGHSLDQTIRLTSKELESPIADEFQRVAEEQALGRALDEALVAFSRRLRSCRTVRTFVVSVLVLRQTGGNLIEVLESIIDTMRQQSQYQKKLAAMTAEGRSSSTMLAGLPPVFALLAGLANPDFIGLLVTDPLGRMLGMISVGLWLTGVVWVRKMTNVEV